MTAPAVKCLSGPAPLFLSLVGGSMLMAIMGLLAGDPIQASLAVSESNAGRRAEFANLSAARAAEGLLALDAFQVTLNDASAVDLVFYAGIAEGGGQLVAAHLWLALDAYRRDLESLGSEHEAEALRLLRPRSTDPAAFESVLPQYPHLKNLLMARRGRSQERTRRP